LKFAGVGNKKFELVEKEEVAEGIFTYRLKPLGGRIIPKAGQYCHIQRHPFGEAHPFTVMESDFSTGVLTFGIKVDGKYSKALSEMKVGTRVSLDGPYGVFTLEGHDSEPKLVIAGGIGVTPFVDLIRRFGDAQTYMFYANRLLNLAVRRDLFKKVLDGRYWDVLDKESREGENVIQGRLTPELLNSTLPTKFLDKAEVFICGPKPFYNAYRKMLLSMEVPVTRIHYEEFGF
jgi:predicted ferric reductase